MRRILKNSFLIAICCLGVSCSKDAPAPANEKEDRGHDLPSKVEIISTELSYDNATYTPKANPQTQTYTVNGVAGLIVNGEAFEWKTQSRYLLEIVYYNAKGERMNSEFVSTQMAPIHQHFFRIEGKKADEMDKIFQYEYQDTNPEEGRLWEDNVTLRKRSWDKNNPDAIDPIGLKGVFSVMGTSQELKLRVTLAHFLGADRGFNKLRNGQVQKYNELPSASFFASDFDVAISVKIVN